MKLRAIINIEFEATDYADAADFQKSMRALLGQVRAEYESAALELKECRRRTATSGDRQPATVSTVRNLYGTGHSHIYEEL